MIVGMVLGAALVGCGSNSGGSAAETTASPAPTTTTALGAATTTEATTTTVGTPTSTSTSTSTSAPAPRELRDVRYCEVLLLGKEGPDFVAHVWNTMGHSDCPQADWVALDPTALAAEHGAPLALLNGPRYWTLDSIQATMQLTAPVASFGAIEMFEAATVNLGPALPDQAPYVEHGVARETVFGFAAGSEVYELTAPNGAVYVMQSYSQQGDPTLTIDQLPTLGSRLQLPVGWTFASRVLDEDLDVLSDADGVATVVQDELRNTYQRVDQ